MAKQELMMKAYAYAGALPPFRLRELPAPRPGAHQVLKHGKTA